MAKSFHFVSFIIFKQLFFFFTVCFNVWAFNFHHFIYGYIKFSTYSLSILLCSCGIKVNICENSTVTLLFIIIIIIINSQYLTCFFLTV